MLPQILEHVGTNAIMILDIEDRYARDRKLRGDHPRAIEPLRFWLLRMNAGGNVRNFPEPYEMVFTRNTGGYHLFFGQVIPSGSLRPISLSFSNGACRLRVTSELGAIRRTKMPALGKIASMLYQSAELDVTLIGLPSGVVGMDSAAPLALEAGYAYPFPPSLPVKPDGQGNCTSGPVAGQPGPTLLRGSLHTLDGSGMLGATVNAPGAQSSYTTDSSGHWVLVFDDAQPSGKLAVTMDIPNQGVLSLPGVCVLHGCETSLPETALRGWVLYKGVGAAGANVQVSGLAQSVQTQADGGWIVVLPPDQGPATVTVTATLLDGSSKPLQNVPVKPRNTVLVSTFQFP
jgi:hypothetical protein